MSHSPQDVYARRLASRRGYPLWTPEPNMSLPPVYIQEGLKIGDVGVVVPEDGSFDVFFNLCMPPGHPLHRDDGVPDNFAPIPLSGRDISQFPRAESAGRIISTSVERVRSGGTTSEEDIERRTQPGPLNYQFTLSSRDGAVLILPEGAERYYLRNERLFMEAAMQHAVDWYAFAEQRLGRIISHDSLYLITGFYKARSWSLAAYQRGTGASHASARFRAVRVGRGNVEASYTWDTPLSMDWRVGPSDQYYQGTANQTVFIQGCKVAIREGILGMKRVHVETGSPTVRPRHAAVSSSLWSSKVRNRVFRSSSYSTADTSQRTGNTLKIDTAASAHPSSDSGKLRKDVTVERFPQVQKPFHPSDIINQFLLRELPSAKVAVTHDSQWTTLLERGSLNREELVQEDRLVAAVMRKYSVESTREGAVYLREISGRSSGGPMKNPVAGRSQNSIASTPVSPPKTFTGPFNSTKPMTPNTWDYRQAIPTGSQHATQASRSPSIAQRISIQPSLSHGAVPTGGQNATDVLSQGMSRLTLATQSPRNQPINVNVVLFGEPGVGKSAVVNLIAQTSIARTPFGANSCALQSARHSISVDGTNVCVFETVGLERQEMTGNGYLATLEKAYGFVNSLSTGGIHLLLFCMRANRLTTATQSNYRFFSQVVFPPKIPMAFVVTGLERESEMDDWWTRNRTTLENFGLMSDGHACVTGITDRSIRQDRNLAKSQEKVRELLKKCCLKTPASLPTSSDWFLHLGRGMLQFVGKHRRPTQGEVVDVLEKRLRFDHKTAQGFVDMMDGKLSNKDVPTTSTLPVVRSTHRGPEDVGTPITKSRSRDRDADKWRGEPWREETVEVSRSGLPRDPGKRDSEPPRMLAGGQGESRGWDDGAQRRDMATRKVTIESPKVNTSYVKSETDMSMEDIRSHDLTGRVTRSDRYVFASSGYGDIYRGRLGTGRDLTNVAMKTYKMYARHQENHSDRMMRFYREVKVWLKLQHPNVLPLYGIVRDINMHPDMPAMVCPWAENGDLSRYLERNGSLQVSHRLSLANDVAHGLQYLHSKDIVHDNLSGSNVLVGADGRAMVADFGLSTSFTAISGQNDSVSRPSTGAVRWMAPELLCADGSRRIPSARSDVYSFGSIMLQILTGNIPYHRLPNDSQVIAAMLEGRRPQRPHHSGITNGRWRFIEWCWSTGGRPSSDEIAGFTHGELKAMGL